MPCERAGAKKTCFCGKLPYVIGCSEKDEGRSCGEVCGKPLNCSEHFCTRTCHTGPCTDCKVASIQICYCGETEQERRCGTGIKSIINGEERHFSCGAQCNQPLSCGFVTFNFFNHFLISLIYSKRNHSCSKICHIDNCGTCPLDPNLVQTCPCGKTSLKKLLEEERKSCLDPIPTCTQNCGKILNCGFAPLLSFKRGKKADFFLSRLHRCKRVCHLGECGPCQEVVKVKCRCGSSKHTKQCFEVECEEIVGTGESKQRKTLKEIQGVPRLTSVRCNRM